MTTYKEAGVDIDKANDALKKIKKLSTDTYNKHVLSNVGGFGGCFEIPKGYDEPVLVSSADGVGTKLKIAFLTGKHNTIGQCLVNHCVNDILTTGAKPMFFLDYYATGTLDAVAFTDVVSGLSKACIENECVLIGGETAEMPGFYSQDEYDLCGTIIGIVEKRNMLSSKDVSSGDKIIALPSDGLHTNGYSLARKVLLEKYKIDSHIDALNCTIGEELLKIHKSYYPAVKEIIDKDWLKCISHITGGGIEENTQRVISKAHTLNINWDSWSWPEIYSIIQKTANVPLSDMRRTFNLGIGLVLIVDKNNVDKCIDYFNKKNQKHIALGEVK